MLGFDLREPELIESQDQFKRKKKRQTITYPKELLVNSLITLRLVIRCPNWRRKNRVKFVTIDLMNFTKLVSL